jgi:hypothetical protein
MRISEEMDRELRAQAEEAGISPTIFARDLIAKGLKQKRLAAMRPAHRPKTSEKS